MAELAEKLDADTFVIGLPKKMDGTDGQSVEMVKTFAEELQKHTNAQIVFMDERLSTVSAERILIESNVRREKRKGIIDSIAATIILQNYLDKIKK
jgi:putative Holliday junction resolvase